MSRRPRAFTLIELLLVIAIIAALLAVVIVSMRSLRLSANRTESTNALRQMVAGYNAYSADNRQTFMPGFLSENMIGDGPNQIDLKPRKEGGGFHEAGDICSYVWRLTPYLDHAWPTLLVDYRNESVVSAITEEVEPLNPNEVRVYGPATVGPDEFGLASVPSFGLNSIFLGGDSMHGGAGVRQNHPFPMQHPSFVHRIAATRYSEVRSPSNLIVFGPVAAANNADPQHPYQAQRLGSHIGYPELRAPYIVTTGEASNWTVWSKRQWEIGEPEGIVISADAGDGFGSGGGLPIVRWGGRHYPVGHLDGSTAVEDLAVLARDMRRWSPFVTGLEVVPVP